MLRAAIELMGERGYDGTSTREIAAAAGVSVAALYHHFPSKLDVLREFLLEAHDVVIHRLSRAVAAAGDDARAQLDAAVAVLISANLHDRFAQLACRVAAQEYRRLPDADRAVVLAKRSAVVGVVEGVLVGGVRSGAFQATDPVPVAWAIVYLCMSAVERYPELDMAMEEVIELHQRLALALASTSPPTRGRRRRSA